MKLRSILLGIGLFLACNSCSAEQSDQPTVPDTTSSRQATSAADRTKYNVVRGEALLQGKLVTVGDECLWAEIGNSQSLVALRWPSDAREVTAEHGGRRVYLSSRKMLKEGDLITAGGQFAEGVFRCGTSSAVTTTEFIVNTVNSH